MSGVEILITGLSFVAAAVLLEAFYVWRQRRADRRRAERRLAEVRRLREGV